MRRAMLCVAVLFLGCTLAPGREPKEYDSDVVYDESKISHHDLPPLLVTAEGKPVTTHEQWRNIRRPQILSLFSNPVYGCVPQPQSPIKMEFEVKRRDTGFMGGKATRQDVQIRFHNDRGETEMLALVFVPHHATKPVPAFMMHSFDDTKSRGFETHPQRKDCLRNGWPLGQANWPCVRGPSCGVAEDAVLPIAGSTMDNVVWEIDVAGRGWSSPIV